MIPGVAPSPYRRILGAFVAAIENDPKLANKRVIKTWLLWDGKSRPADITADQMPAIQLQLVGGPVRRLASTRLPGRPMTYANESNPSIIISLMTKGSDQGDLADVAALVVAALAPADPLARAALETRFKDAGIKDWQLTREILPLSAESFDVSAISGQGTYELTVFLSS